MNPTPILASPALPRSPRGKAAFLVHKTYAAYRHLETRGFGSFCNAAYNYARVKLGIMARGQNRAVDLDGCSFPLKALPNTSMKLELLSGRYEEPERSAARRYIRPEWPVVELGGCFGVVACITNRLLRNPKAHVVLEANPLVIPYLEFNREANRCCFQILNKALAYGTDHVTFKPCLDFWGNSVNHDGGQAPVTVPATTLGEILQQEKFQKFALICDIEGQEYELVMRELDALHDAELIILEVHPHMIGEDKVRTMIAALAGAGFKIVESSKQVMVLRKS